MKQIQVVELTPSELENLIDNSLRRALLETSLTKASSGRQSLLNIQDVAKLLTLSVHTVYARVSKNEIPCMKVGKRLYFNEQEIIEWVQAGKRNTSIETEVDAYLMSQKKGGKR